MFEGRSSKDSVGMWSKHMMYLNEDVIRGLMANMGGGKLNPGHIRQSCMVMCACNPSLGNAGESQGQKDPHKIEQEELLA